MRRSEWFINGIRMIPTEEEEQTALFSWAELNTGRFPELRWLFHIPNGGKRSKREAARFRAAGVRAGISDLFLPCPRGSYHGLWIEMKALDGRPSLEQKVFIRDMKAAGYAALICYGAEEAEAVISRYLSGAELSGEEAEK